MEMSFAKIPFYVCLFILCQSFEVPEVTFQVLKPKGVRVSIPDVTGTLFFAFHGNVNSKIPKDDVGGISGEVFNPTDGRWVFEDQDVELRPNDEIQYYIMVTANGVGYVKDGLTYKVRETVEPSTDKGGSVDPNCVKSLTTVKRKPVCTGEVIFEDAFSSLNNETWQIEHRIPVNHAEFPFVSYQNLRDVIDVRDGKLRIAPALLQAIPPYNVDSIRSGTLDLFVGCTEAAESCYQQAVGFDVLPPVVSGRINSKNSFSFRYGVVEVRAKLPRGDWIYPEILLEPILNRYGSKNFASGVVKIAFSRGNMDLRIGSKKINNQVLYGGVIMTQLQCHDTLLTSKEASGKRWGDDFHTYTLQWEPDRMVFSVDGAEWTRFEAEEGGLRSRVQSCAGTTERLWAMGSKMAPFDEEFYLTLGVAAGGITEFPDNLVTGNGKNKPWTNLSSKAKLHFWQDLDSWFSTWGQQSTLLIDSIKVTAL